MTTELITSMDRGEARQKTEEIKSQTQCVHGLIVEMHDREGWKALGYKTWGQYVEQEFDESRSRIFQILKHSKIVARIEKSTRVDFCPQHEKQTRELARVPEEQQAIVWQKAVETAPKDKAGKPKVTAAHVKTVVAKVVPKVEKPKPEPAKPAPVAADPPPPADPVQAMVEQYQALTANQRTKFRAAIDRLDAKEIGSGVVIPLEFQTPEFLKAWDEWLKYRRSRKLTVAKITLQKQLNVTLHGLTAKDAANVIQHSIANGYQGLFPEKVKAEPRGRKDEIDYKVVG